MIQIINAEPETYALDYNEGLRHYHNPRRVVGWLVNVTETVGGAVSYTIKPLIIPDSNGRMEHDAILHPTGEMVVKSGGNRPVPPNFKNSNTVNAILRMINGDVRGE